MIAGFSISGVNLNVRATPSALFETNPPKKIKKLDLVVQVKISPPAFPRKESKYKAAAMVII
jgi:hypothetical protein